MDQTPFDLLSLPIVAIRKSFSLMSPTQILRASRTSDLCKNMIKSTKFNVEIRAEERDVFILYAGGRFLKIVPIGPEDGKMEEEEWRQAVTEITQLFGTSLTDLDVKTNDFDATWKWIHQEQRGMRKLALYVENAQDPRRNIKRILENSELKQLEYLNLHFKTSDTFKYTDPFIFKNTPKRLWIDDASWFTVQNLMDSKVERLDLSNVKFTNEEINFILKQWMNKVDCFTNLKSITMYRENDSDINFDVAFNGFQRENQRVHNGYTSFRITCEKEFYLEVGDFDEILEIHKKPCIADSVNAVADESHDSDEFSDFEESDGSDEFCNGHLFFNYVSENT